MHTLLIYDRRAGKLLRKQQLATRARALEARFAAEAELGIDENTEIVAIAAEFEEVLRRSPGRYVFTAEGLAGRLATA